MKSENNKPVSGRGNQGLLILVTVAATLTIAFPVLAQTAKPGADSTSKTSTEPTYELRVVRQKLLLTTQTWDEEKQGIEATQKRNRDLVDLSNQGYELKTSMVDYSETATKLKYAEYTFYFQKLKKP